MRSTKATPKQVTEAGLDEGRKPLSASEKRLRSETAKWIGKDLVEPGRNVYGVTLTCHQWLSNDAGERAWLTRSLLSEEIRKFFRRLDSAVYGQRFRRFNKKLRRFCAIEGGDCSGTRLHAHLLIQAPEAGRAPMWEFRTLILKEWRKSEWSLPNAYVDPCADEIAAASYMAKSGADAIDWENCVV